MRFLLLILFGLLFHPFAHTQNASDFQSAPTGFSLPNVFHDIDVQVYLGPSLAIPLGDTIQSQRLLLEEFASSIDSNSQTFTSRLAPQYFYHFGFLAHYPINPWLGISTGWEYQQRGYRLATDLDYRDPVYQYDELLQIRQAVKINYLEWPFLAQFQPKQHEHWRFSAGFTFGFPILKNRNKTMAKIRKDLYINGERAEEASYPYRREEWSLVGTAKSITSATIGIYYQMNNRFRWQLMAKQSTKLWHHQQTLRNTIVNLSLAFDLNP